MVRSVSRARSAATEPVAGVRDWYDGAIFRSAVSAGYFASITSVALSISTDGFEAWRQRGYQRWPVIATVLNVEPHETVRLSSQLMLCVTPGPRQPADLESFLHPIAKQLDILARGISGVKVAECPTSQVVHAYALQFTTDMPAGDKLLNATDITVPNPTVFAILQAVIIAAATTILPKTSSQGHGYVLSMAVAHPGGPPQASRQVLLRWKRLDKQAKVKLRFSNWPAGLESRGILNFFAPSLADRQRYPNLSYLWSLGPSALPYDPMHLILSNVVPLLWKLFSGEIGNLGDTPEPYRLFNLICVNIGKEISAGISTVPLSQARSLRNIQLHFGSYKAVDWLYFLLSTGEVVLADRLPEQYYSLFMLLCQAGRLLFKPSAVTQENLRDIDKCLKKFCSEFYRLLYTGRKERLGLSRSTVVALLDVVSCICYCGPAWSFWQFPTERYIGSMARLIRSRRYPHAALTRALSRKFTAELRTCYAETYVPAEWAEATGKPCSRELTSPPGTFKLQDVEDADVQLLPPAAEAS